LPGKIRLLGFSEKKRPGFMQLSHLPHLPVGDMLSGNFSGKDFNTFYLRTLRFLVLYRRMYQRKNRPFISTN